MYSLSLYSLKMNAIYSFRIPHIASHAIQIFIRNLSTRNYSNNKKHEKYIH